MLLDWLLCCCVCVLFDCISLGFGVVGFFAWVSKFAGFVAGVACGLGVVRYGCLLCYTIEFVFCGVDLVCECF